MSVIHGSNYGTPALDLDFSGRKSLNDRVSGNSVTFTRDSVGTYVDSNGIIQTATAGNPRYTHNPLTGESLGLLVEEARTNQLLYSQDFSQWTLGASTTIAHGQIAPDGSSSASLLTIGNGTFVWNASIVGITRTIYPVTTDVPYVYSAYFKSNGANYAVFRIASGGIDGAVWYNFATGAIDVLNTHPSYINKSLTISNAGGGWFRICFGFTPDYLASTPGGLEIHLLCSTAQLSSVYNRSSSGDGSSGVYIWGAQLEAGSFPTSYIPTPATFTSRASTATYYDANRIIQTAGINVARSNAYFPDSNGVMRPAGLLLEAAGTNLIAGSQTFNAGGWNVDGISITNNATTAPDGTVTAASVVQGTGSNRTFHFDNNGAGNKTLTIFAKSNAGSSLTLTGSLTYGSNNTGSAVLNTSNGTVTVATGCSSVALPNGWYRFTIPVFIGTGTGNTNYYSINGPSTSVYIWGMQVEASPYATSYIPTTTATVTRAADISSSATVTRSADIATLTNTNLFTTTEDFTYVNKPFGTASGSNTINLVGPTIKRTTVYPTNLSRVKLDKSTDRTDEFWQWRILGSSFALPNFATDGQVTVDWGDGTVEVLTTSEHTFTDGGGYHDIGFRLDSGTYFRPYINDNASHDTKVVALGPAPESMKLNGERAFFGCTNLKAFDATVDATGGTNFLAAWQGCSSLTSFPLINTAAGTSFNAAWVNCSSLTSFPLINTAVGTDFQQAWYSCSSLTSFPLIDTAAGTNFFAAWAYCNSLTSFPLINTAAGTNFSNAWQNCSSLTSFPLINTAAGTNFTAAWYGCSDLDNIVNAGETTSFPLINTAAGTNFLAAWLNCSSLTSFPLINTAAGTNFQQAWYNCSSLTSFPLINTAAGTNFYAAWTNCSSLTSFPLINTAAGTNFSYAWQNCTSLTSFPLINTAAGTDFGVAWYNCNSLTSFPLINTASGTNFYLAWYNCSSLTSFPLIDTAAGTNFNAAWRSCSSLTSFPLINTASGTNFNLTWYGCSSLTSFPLIDSGAVTNFIYAWWGCSSLTSFPLINTSSGIAFNEAWGSCSSLTSFPLINTAAGTNFNRAWQYCSGLTSFPLINTAAGTDFGNAWLGCSSLTSFPPNFFDSWTGTPVNNCFVNAWDACSSLTATSVENILNSIDTSGQSAPASGVDITIDYNASSGTPDVTVSGVDLIRKGWTTTLNGSLKNDPTQFASLDLDFATNKSLIDNVSGNNLITFTRSSTGTYVDANGIIQSAAVNEARFDHDPVTGESLGLLIEESRVNYHRYSTNFANWAPNIAGSTLTATTETLDPAGETGAYVLYGWMQRNSEPGPGSGASFPFRGSVFVKRHPSGTNTFIMALTAGGGDSYITINFDTETVSASGQTPQNPTIQKLPNGWYRIGLTITPASTSWRPVLGTTPSASSYWYVYGVQVETGVFDTSYIPTAGSTVTRSADVASITGSNFSSWYNQSEGTMFADAKMLFALSGSSFPDIYTTGGYPNRLWILYLNQPGGYGLTVGADAFSRALATFASSPQSFKVAQSLSNTSLTYSVSKDGGTSLTGGMSALASTSSLSFGSSSGAVKYISRLTYYPRRLKDTSLQYLTQ